MIHSDYKDWRLHPMRDNIENINFSQNMSSKPPSVRPSTPSKKTKFSRRRGLRKRFLSLTDGLSQIFSNERKTNDSSLKIRPDGSLGARFSSEPEELNSGYWSDLSSDYSTKQIRQQSFSARPSPEMDGNHPPTSAKRQKFFRFNKTPPSPPPRRYSLWGKDIGGKQRKKSIGSVEKTTSIGIKPRKDSSPSARLSYTPAMSLPLLPAFNGNADNNFHGQHFIDFEQQNNAYDRSGNNLVRGGSIVSNASTNSSINSQQLNGYAASAVGEIIERTISVVIDKSEGSFGFTVRGGLSSSGKSRPFVVTQVRSGGPADREATLRPGDRLLAVDGKDISRTTLSEVQKALKCVVNRATFTLSYDVSIMDTVRTPGNALLVEIERNPRSSLGVTLAELKSANFHMHSKHIRSSVVIENIRTASVAERCGALAVGDFVNAVDGVRVDSYNLQEMNRILQSGDSNKITLEIVPCKLNSYKLSKDIYETPGNRFSLYNTCGPRRQYNNSTTSRLRRKQREDPIYSGRSSTVNHTEVARITLRNEGMTLGVVLRPAPLMADPQFSFPTVAAIEPCGIADKAGVIFVGDKLLAVNGMNVGGLGVTEILQMMVNARPTLTVDIEFEVADAVVPSSGTFSVKLAKSNGGVGISIAKSRAFQQSNSDEYVLISEVVRGSPAHRSGTLEVGDRILAVNNTRVDNYSLEDTRKLICGDGDIVTLKIQKDDLSSENGLVTYTVQLMKDGSSLGIFPSGGGSPFDPIYIRAIAPDSIAERTRAIHIGDRILAINGVSLRGKTLNETSILLHNPDDTLTMTVARQKDANPTTEWETTDVGHPAMSVDSAVESWDSGGGGGLDALQNLSTLKEGDETSQVNHENSSSYGSNKNSIGTDNRKVSSPVPSVDSGQSEEKADWDKMIADLNHISETCGLRQKELEHCPNGLTLQTQNMERNHKFPSARMHKIHPAENSTYFNQFEDRNDIQDQDGIYSISRATELYTNSPFSSDGVQVFTITIQKDPVYEDFGFSVSDGLYEKGVYINRIRTGGPADRCVILKPFDRILQVNNTNTDDFDCCLIVPLIASAGESLFLKLMRTGLHLPLANFESKLIWRDTLRDHGHDTSYK